MLKIWGRAEALCAQRVLWSCEELHLPFRRFDPDRTYGVKPAGPLADEPIPLVDERGLTVWEPNALMRYLFAQFGPRVPPSQRRLTDNWVEWTTSSLLPGLRLMAASLMRLRADHPDGLLARRADECAGHLVKLDDALAASPFIAGDELTVADVAAGVAVWFWTTTAPDRPNLHRLSLWLERLKLRTGFERHVARPLAPHRTVTGTPATSRSRGSAGTLAPAG